MQPCQDNYCTTFGSLALMMDYHERQTTQSNWQRVPISALRVLPLDEASLPAVSALPFATPVSQEAIKDTVSNLGLAVDSGDGLYPVRNTAFYSLLGRAKIGGTVLQKLPRPDLAKIINLCLKEHKSDALLLIRDEKVSAVLAGDEKDYSILPIDALMKALKDYLDDRFPGYAFDNGYSDHSVSAANWKLNGQRSALLSTYEDALATHGKTGMMNKLVPGIKFITSDVGVSSAAVSALLYGLSQPIRIGTVVSVEHRRNTTVAEFDKALEMMYAQFVNTVDRLEKLLDVYLDYPVNVMTGVCKKLSLPKKPACAAIEMFSMAVGSDPASAHDVYMGLQEILFSMKSSGTPESKLLSVEESIARALTLNWDDFDIAGTVSY